MDPDFYQSLGRDPLLNLFPQLRAHAFQLVAAKVRSGG